MWCNIQVLWLLLFGLFNQEFYRLDAQTSIAELRYYENNVIFHMQCSVFYLVSLSYFELLGHGY